MFRPEWIARFLPITHALALMRYGMLGAPVVPHDIWAWAPRAFSPGYRQESRASPQSA
jgi:hypothetical protein